MNRYLILASLFFMASSLFKFMAQESLASVLLFACASLVFSFLIYLDRKKVEDLDQLKAQVSDLRQQVSVMQSLGM